MEDRQRSEPWFLIREHANGWISQIESSETPGKWHVAAYPTQQDAPPAPVNAYVSGQRDAMRLANTLVEAHAPHRCDHCGPWRPSDEQRLSQHGFEPLD